MSEGTTKSNDSREPVKVSNEEIERRMRAADYNIEVNFIEPAFFNKEADLIKFFHDHKSEEYFSSPEARAELEAAKKKASGNNNNNNTSGGSGGFKKAGDCTLVGEEAHRDFNEMIPYIATGPAAQYKHNKNKAKTNKQGNTTKRTDKRNTEHEK